MKYLKHFDDLTQIGGGVELQTPIVIGIADDTILFKSNNGSTTNVTVSGDTAIIDNGSESGVSFSLRQSGGGTGNPYGTAAITNIKGQTLFWNQLSNMSGTTINVTNSGSSIMYEKIGNIGAYTKQRETHKIFAQAFCSSSLPSGTYVYFTDRIQTHIDVKPGQIFSARSSFEAPHSGHICYIAIPSGATVNSTISVVFIDLSLMYGMGKEPTTVAAFKTDVFNRFGINLDHYLPYTEGKFKHFTGGTMESVGLNQWDEEWEVGWYDPNTGQKGVLDTNMRNKNFIPVLPSTTYYYTRPSAAISMKVLEYDENKNFKRVKFNGADLSATTSPDTYFLNFNLSMVYGPTYHNDVTINFSNANVNGTYEPYWKLALKLPITQITGKVNGQGDSVVVFPTGMKSIGTIYDEIYEENGVTYAVKRIGEYDMGLMGVTAGYVDSSHKYGYFSLSNHPLDRKSGVTNVLTEKYVTPGSFSTCDIALCPNSTTGINFWVVDGDYVTPYPDITKSGITYTFDPAGLKASLDGVKMIYELATPIVYVLDHFKLPLKYRRTAYGSEQNLPKSDATNMYVTPTYNINRQ